MLQYFNKILLFAAQSLCLVYLPWWYSQHHFPTNGELLWLNLMIMTGIVGSIILTFVTDYLISYLTCLLIIGFSVKYYFTAHFPLLSWGLQTFKLTIEGFREEKYRYLIEHLWSTFYPAFQGLFILFFLNSLVILIWKKSIKKASLQKSEAAN